MTLVSQDRVLADLWTSPVEAVVKQNQICLCDFSSEQFYVSAGERGSFLKEIWTEMIHGE